MQRLDERLRRYFDSLDLSSYGRLHGVRLTELAAIHRSDVEIWTRIQDVRAVRRIGEHEVRALYERDDLRTADGLISMEKLADELRKLLSSNRRKGDN